MKVSPAIFSAPMVRALLSGDKTQTRRMARRRVKTGCDDDAPVYAPSAWTKVKPTDLIYVRENVTRFDKGSCDQHIWYWAGMNGVYDDCANSAAKILGRPDGTWPADKEGPGTGKAYSVPCIHMPRWASRITLDVDAVKIERLQDISAEDAIAEGIENVDHLRIMPQAHRPAWRAYVQTPPPETRGNFGLLPSDLGAYTHDPRVSYATLWDSLHGAGAWASNPEVVATTFFVHRRNVDSIVEQRKAATTAV